MNITAGTDGMARPVAEHRSDTFRTRLLSAAILAPLVLGLVWLGGWYFSGLLLVVGTLMVFEWDRLCGGTGRGIHVHILVVTIIAACVFSGMGDLKLALVVSCAGAGLATIVNLKDRPRWTALGSVYILLPMLALLWIRSDDDKGLLTIMWMLLVVWATDTGAYFAGKSIGGPKMAPRLSPNKTWAGLIGGAIAAALVSMLVGYMAGAGSAEILAIAGILAAITGQVGDVSQSSVKRHFGVKDSGAIIPGHGGLFDRLDSLLVVGAVVAASSIFAGKAVVWQ
jgi:phosphatidate cytidylyltransferase